MVTNDAWFGGGAGPAQHYVMARYRAIEEGLPVARAASGGVSAIIDAYGQAVRESRGGAGGVEAQLPPALEETIWARQGAMNLVILLVILAALRFFPAAGLARGPAR
jgi:apolipoprotein N-acyltransferase